MDTDKTDFSDLFREEQKNKNNSVILFDKY